MNLRWSLGRPDPRPVPLGRPRRVGRHRPRSGAAARPGDPRAARRPGRRPRLHALPRRGARGAAALPRRRPLVPGPRRLPAALGRLLLPRVRHRRGAAAVLGRPRRAGRRPPEGGQRPRPAARRASASSTATGTSASRCRPTAGSRSATPTSTPTRWPSCPCDDVRVEVDLAGGPLRRPGVEGRRRPRSRSTCSTPTSRRTRPTSAASPTASTAATPSTGCARRSSSASAACGPSTRSASTRRCSTPTRATPAFLGLERIRQLVKDPGLSLPRGHRGRPGRLPVHHPHAGARRHRPLPPRAHRAVLRGVGGRGRHHARRADGPRPPARRHARRALQHGRDGPAPRRAVQRRGQAPRRREPGDVRRPLARRSRRGGADHLDHQRRARPHVGRRRRWRPAARATCCPSGTRPTADAVGAHRRGPRRRAVAGPRAGPRGAGRLRAPAAPAAADGPRAVRLRRRVDRLGARPQGAHDRLRPPLRHLQAGHAPAVAARPAPAPCCSPATGPCSSSSPASRTRPTTPARS